MPKRKTRRAASSLASPPTATQSRLGPLIRSWSSRCWVPTVLFTCALVTRLPLLSTSLDEVDSANFVNALTFGYDIPLLRPHPPGYPVYVFMGNLVRLALGDPMLSLCVLSALLGSLAVVPFYWLLDDIVGRRFAVAGALVFIVQPLGWSFSETALGDVPAMCVAVWMAWISYRARDNMRVFLVACIVASLMVGVRQSSLALVPLLLVPIVYRQGPWRQRLILAISGALLFMVVTAAWVLPMIVAGSAGFSDYSQAVAKQWSTAVSVYQWSQIEEPQLLNLVLRCQRFFYAYFLTWSWTGDDAKTPLTLLLVSPWLFGFSLFVVSFRVRSATHVLVALWIASIAYVALSIHFLARYALPQTPGFLMACVMGFAFLRTAILVHPRRFELLLAISFSCTLMLYGIKYQSPVGSFEYTPPAGSLVGGVFVTAGFLLLLIVRAAYWRSLGGTSLADGPSRLATDAARPWSLAYAAGWAVLVIAFGAQGYALASIAHREQSPTHRLVEFVATRYGTRPLTPCWDNLTHSSFEAILPQAVPTGYWSIRDLYAAHDAGRVLIVTDKCAWFRDLDESLGLVRIASFEGRSPLWSKAPELHLYVPANRSDSVHP